jgi:hypothetical protein
MVDASIVLSGLLSNFSSSADPGGDAPHVTPQARGGGVGQGFGKEAAEPYHVTCRPSHHVLAGEAAVVESRLGDGTWGPTTLPLHADHPDLQPYMCGRVVTCALGLLVLLVQLIQPQLGASGAGLRARLRPAA